MPAYYLSLWVCDDCGDFIESASDTDYEQDVVMRPPDEAWRGRIGADGKRKIYCGKCDEIHRGRREKA